MGLQLHLTVLEDLKRAAWARTSPVSDRGQSWDFRKDCLGNVVRYSDYGKRNSPFGWELDFVLPRKLVGADLDNVQALHWKACAARADLVPRGLRTTAIDTPAEVILA